MAILDTGLGIPRGGIITASAVAKKLCADFEFVASNRLASHDEEITIGAVVENGDLDLNDDVVEALDLSNEVHLKREKQTRWNSLNPDV